VSSGVSACGFALGMLFAGHGKLAPCLLSRTAAYSVRAGGWVKDRAEPGRVSGAGGVLDAGAREPIIRAAGKEPRCLGAVVYAVVCAPRPVVRPGSPLAAFIPSFVPGVMCCRGAWGGFASGAGRGQSDGRPRCRAGRAGPLVPAGDRMFGGLAPGGGGQNSWRSRARLAGGHAAGGGCCLAGRRMRPSRMP
jgi:hypothetical protein